MDTASPYYGQVRLLIRVLPLVAVLAPSASLTPPLPKTPSSDRPSGPLLPA